MQNAVDQSPHLLPDNDAFPAILNIELDRQSFNEKTRTWQKLNDKVSLDDSITVKGQKYTLYGFITHDRDLQSGSFTSIVR
jgi:ubiquitin C-terminal hydrolase